MFLLVFHEFGSFFSWCWKSQPIKCVKWAERWGGDGTFVWKLTSPHIFLIWNRRGMWDSGISVTLDQSYPSLLLFSVPNFKKLLVLKYRFTLTRLSSLFNLSVTYIGSIVFPERLLTHFHFKLYYIHVPSTKFIWRS